MEVLVYLASHRALAQVYLAPGAWSYRQREKVWSKSLTAGHNGEDVSQLNFLSLIMTGSITVQFNMRK